MLVLVVYTSKNFSYTSWASRHLTNFNKLIFQPVHYLDKAKLLRWFSKFVPVLLLVFGTGLVTLLTLNNKKNLH